MSLAMLLVGGVAILLMALLADRPDGVAVLGVAAALGIGVGLAWLIRAISSRGRRTLATTWRGCWRPPSTTATYSSSRRGCPASHRTWLRCWSARLACAPWSRVAGTGTTACAAGRGSTTRTAAEDGSRAAPTHRSTPMPWPTRWPPGREPRWTSRRSPIIPAVAFPRAWSVIVLEEPDGRDRHLRQRPVVGAEHRPPAAHGRVAGRSFRSVGDGRLGYGAEPISAPPSRTD